MPSKKPTLPETYTDVEVRKTLNNAVISLVRWERLKDAKSNRAKQLSAFTLELVDTLQEDVLVDPDTKEAVMLPAELALCLMTACIFVVFRHVIPNGMALEKSFINQMTGERD